LSLLKKHRIYIFLIKLKSNLKVKILDIDNVSNTRNKLLIIIIMQKQMLNYIREINARESKNNKKFDFFV